MAIYARLEDGTYAEVTGVYKTDGTEVTEIFQSDRLVYSASNELYGTVPLYYDGLGYELIDYLISGNAVQDGTPSADAPVDATGSGVRTGNLFDAANRIAIVGYIDSTGTIVSNSANACIICKVEPDTTYTVSADMMCTNGNRLTEFSEEPVIGSKGTVVMTKSPPNLYQFTITTGLNTKYIAFHRGVSSEAERSEFYNKTMLNLGSTALPYEPYGIKLDISNGGENLFDATTLENGIYLAASGNKYGGVTNGVRSGTKIKVSPNTAYTLSAQSSEKVTLRIFEWSNGAFTKQTPKYNISGSVSLTVTTTAETTEIAFNIEGENGQYATNIMLNLGSTAKPYSPYNRTATPIYLGTVPTTRRVKKLVLTGEENWQIYTSVSNTYRLSISNNQSVGNPALCSHFVNSSISAIASGKFTIGSTWIYIRYADVADLTAFKSYLAAQYAAGTPVTVWYVLAEPETAVVNEPLMKIGDYADTISFAQAGVTIPTVNGANVLNMASTVKPSEVYIKGKGIKPTGYGQLKDVNGVSILDKNGRPINVHGQ